MNLKVSVDKGEIAFDEAEFSARCGTPIGEHPLCFDEVYRAVYSEITPSYAYTVLDIAECAGEMKIGTVTTDSVAIHKVLSGCRRAIFLLCTLGASVQRQIQRQSAISLECGFVADCIADSLCESLASLAEKRVKEIEGVGFSTGRFSPGYADLSLEFGRDVVTIYNLGKSIGVTFTDSSLMLPTKTISAIIGIKDN